MNDAQYIEVRVHARVDSAELAGMVAKPGLMGVWDAEGVIHVYWALDRWSEAIAKHIKKVIGQLGGYVEGDEIEVLQVPWQDWNAQWAALVKPYRIGRRILIRPSWDRGMLPDNGIELILDPGQAFGTGQHVTTQLLIEWLEEIVRGNERVLDIGTGTGILAMVALRLGAEFALGIDQDPIAIRCASAYAATNGFGSEFDLHVATLDDLTPTPFDLILANLDRPTLLSTSHQFHKFKNRVTTVLLSGILREDRDDVLESFHEQGLDLQEVRERDGWLAIGLKG